jgi:hypothetical protein
VYIYGIENVLVKKKAFSNSGCFPVEEDVY